MDFTWLGNQMCTDTLKKKLGAWIRRPVSIWCDHHLPHAAQHFFAWSWSGCWLWNVVLLLFNANLLDIGGNWNTLLYMSIQSISNVLNGCRWHVWWVCRPWKNWDFFQLPGIVCMHYHAETWDDGRKMVRAYVFTPFAMKPLNKIWCNQLPSEVT